MIRSTEIQLNCSVELWRERVDAACSTLAQDLDHALAAPLLRGRNAIRDHSAETRSADRVLERSELALDRFQIDLSLDALGTEIGPRSRSAAKHRDDRRFGPSLLPDHHRLTVDADRFESRTPATELPSRPIVETLRHDRGCERFTLPAPLDQRGHDVQLGPERALLSSTPRRTNPGTRARSCEPASVLRGCTDEVRAAGLRQLGEPGGSSCLVEPSQLGDHTLARPHTRLRGRVARCCPRATWTIDIGRIPGLDEALKVEGDTPQQQPVVVVEPSVRHDALPARVLAEPSEHLSTIETWLAFHSPVRLYL